MKFWASRKQEDWGNTPEGIKTLGKKEVAKINKATRGKKLPKHK